MVSLSHSYEISSRFCFVKPYLHHTMEKLRLVIFFPSVLACMGCGRFYSYGRWFFIQSSHRPTALRGQHTLQNSVTKLLHEHHHQKPFFILWLHKMSLTGTSKTSLLMMSVELHTDAYLEKKTKKQKNCIMILCNCHLLQSNWG